MIFLYREIKQGICILRVFGKDEIVELPDEIQGKKVTELGAYAFSDKIDRKELQELLKSGKLCDETGRPVESAGDLPEVEGTKVREICFPSELKKIGRYAFYNCFHLWKIRFYGALTDIGAGAFTGCHKIGRLEVHINEEGISCLRELLTELPEEVCVDYYRGEEQGRFLYPEFFEEGVENTPARILENHVHGSGIRYRNAFSHKVLNIREYDELFEYAKAWEAERTVTELALDRLLCPLELTQKAEVHYLEYVEEHLAETAGILLKQKEYSALGNILEKLKPSREAAEEIIQLAERSGDPQGVSVCMNYLHLHTKKTRKVFEF